MNSAARARWNALPASLRKLLLSHRPTELEREEKLLHSVMTALSNVFGPRTFGPEIALHAEPDHDYEPPENLYARTLREIADELDLSVEHVRQVEQRALRRMKEAFERMEQERLRACALSEHTGLTFKEAFLLVQEQADGKLWELIDEPRRIAQAKRTEKQAKRDRENAQREREQREREREQKIAMTPTYTSPKSYLPSFAPLVNMPPLMNMSPYAPYEASLLPRFGPHGWGCQCPWPPSRK